MQRGPLASAALVGLVALVGAAAPAPAAGKEYKVVEVKNGGTVRGFVRIAAEDKEKFALPKIAHFKDNDKGCGDPEQPSERFVFDAETLGVGGALVFLKDMAEGKDWPEAMKKEDRTSVIDQKGCRYMPHVQWVRGSTQMIIVNSDAADHNIHGFVTPAEKNSLATTRFNFTSAPNSRNEDTADAFLEDAGLYLVKCDVHPWMSAYVHVVDHPYHVVTSEKAEGDLKPGEFRLTDVPAGSYTLVVWKEGMHEMPIFADAKISAYNYSDNMVLTFPVTVEAGKDAVVEAKLAPQPK